jgi:hypothetical protein
MTADESVPMTETIDLSAKHESITFGFQYGDILVKATLSEGGLKLANLIFGRH